MSAQGYLHHRIFDIQFFILIGLYTFAEKTWKRIYLTKPTLIDSSAKYYNFCYYYYSLLFIIIVTMIIIIIIIIIILSLSLLLLLYIFIRIIT